MTQVQVDWLTVVLGPVALVALMIGVGTAWAAAQRSAPVPTGSRVAQVVAVVLALFIAVIHMAWGG